MAELSEFIKEYVKAITEGYAAVFAGAGLSRGSGYLDWKDLVRPLAEDINLNVDYENDLVEIIQYYRNEKGTRFSINQRILNEFTKDTSENANIDILTRLPIQTYWTTNYDELLENSISKNNRKVDVKKSQDNLAQNIYGRDAVVYKMHGDVRDPSHAVLTKEDYEIYGLERPLFRTTLQGDLVSKTFLFIGFSFEDSNLDYVLSQIRVLLGESIRDHYCFLKEISRNECDSEEEYIYKKVKQNLRINDLKRYGIQAILLDEYSKITPILQTIEEKCYMKNIFISGSIAHYSDPWSQEIVNSFTHLLARRIVKSDNRIISGFGVGIGSTIINGALEEIMSSKYKHVDEYLCLRPFPQIASGNSSISEIWKKYRHEMIGNAGIVIFIFGNKRSDDTIIEASGMIEEYHIAKALGKYIIPIGSTGGASLKIFEEVCSNLSEYPYLEKFVSSLRTETDYLKLLDIIDKIIIALQKI